MYKGFYINLAKHKERNQKLIGIGGLVLLLIGLVFIVNEFRKNSKTNALLASKKDIIEQQRNEIVESIQYAKRIQTAILPPLDNFKNALGESFVIYLPKDIVAGDFYWMEETENEVLFAAADCTGHGVPGAMVSFVCNNGLNRSVRELNLREPGEILNHTRDFVLQELSKSNENVADGMDIALCSINGRTLKYSGTSPRICFPKKNET